MKGALMARLITILALIATGAAAQALGPPARTMAILRHTAPPGGPLRVDLAATCTATLPPNPEQGFHVSGVSGEVAGSWVEVPRQSGPGFTWRRLEFRPNQPLAAGSYTVRGLRLMEGFDDVQTVEVPPAQGDPPFYGGAEGVMCGIDNDPRLCRKGVSIFFRVTGEDKLANPIWIVRVRKRGAPYLEADAWEGLSLPLELLAGRQLTGATIATLDQRDEAGREGHYYCEVALTLPDATCAQFPSPPPASGGASRSLPVQCPKLMDDGSLVSAIDGQVLFKAAPSPKQRSDKAKWRMALTR